MKGIQNLSKKIKIESPLDLMEFKKNLTIHVCQFIGGQGVFPF
jgi:hypothetical protein